MMERPRVWWRTSRPAHAVTQTFTGINDTVYGPTTTPPTDPGTYKVAVTYTMEAGYDQIQPQYANLTLNKANPEAPGSCSHGCDGHHHHH